MDKTLRDRLFAQFVGSVSDRLDAGAREYGDTSFERPLTEVSDELAQEALDIAGWGFVLWCRIQSLGRKLQ